MFLLAGIFGGLASSVPVGPTNLWIVNAVVPPKKSDRNIAAFLSGIIITDVLCAFISFWGFYTYFNKTTYAQGIAIVGAFALVAYGITELFKSKAVDDIAIQEKKSNAHWGRDLFFGLVIGSNPAFVVFWVFVAGALSGWGLNDVMSWPAPMFYVGMVIGDLAWYIGFTLVMKKGVKYLSQKIIYMTRLGIAFSFIAFGISALIQLL